MYAQIKDPKLRASAESILQHPFFKEADSEEEENAWKEYCKSFVLSASHAEKALPELQKSLANLYHLHIGEENCQMEDSSNDLNQETEDFAQENREKLLQVLAARMVTEEQRDKLAEQFGLKPSNVDDEIISILEELCPPPHVA